MLASDIKAKLECGEAVIGLWMSMAHVSIAEILAMAGYDFVVVETEHTAIDVSEVLTLMIALKRRGAVPLVRLAWNDPIQCKAVLDSGAAGVLVPMVNTKEDAELAVRSVRYPPLGFRGVGLARAQGYGQDFDAYVRGANDATLLIVQMSTWTPCATSTRSCLFPASTVRSSDPTTCRRRWASRDNSTTPTSWRRRTTCSPPP